MLVSARTTFKNVSAKYVGPVKENRARFLAAWKLYLHKNSSSPVCESVLPLNSAYEGPPESWWPHPALPPPALPVAPAAWRSPPHHAACEPVPARPSSAQTREPHLPPVMWRYHLWTKHGGPDRVPPGKWTTETLGSPS